MTVVFFHSICFDSTLLNNSPVKSVDKINFPFLWSLDLYFRSKISLIFLNVFESLECDVCLHHLVTDDQNAYIGLFASVIKTDNVRFLIQCQEHCFPRLSWKKKNNCAYLVVSQVEPEMFEVGKISQKQSIKEVDFASLTAFLRLKLSFQYRKIISL